MPLYEYQCEECDHRFEVIQKFSDPPLETCPKCGGPVRKLLSSPAIQFKGSGWYITDYARKGAPDAGSNADGGSASAETAAKAEKTDAGKTDKAEKAPAASGVESSPKSTASPKASADPVK